MTPKNLKDLLAFAKVKGLTSVIDVMNAFNKAKMYRHPRVTIELVEYKKRKMTHKHMDTLINRTINKKERIHKIFCEHGVNCNIVIGGSLSLKWQCQEFSDRDFHDIDLIVYPRSEGDRQRLQSFLIDLIAVGACHSTSEIYVEASTSFMFGELKFCGECFPINIIIGETRCLPPFGIIVNFNCASEVIEAKLNYIKNTGHARLKDYVDCYIWKEYNL